MKVIPQDKDMIVDFTCGVWRLCNNNIIMESLNGSHVWLFASFDTIDIASSVFDNFIESAMNDSTVAFDFSKVNSNGEFIDAIPDLLEDKSLPITYN